MNTLFYLTLSGSVMFLLLWAVEHRVAGRMSTRWRRYWWVAVMVAFLIPPLLPVGSVLPVASTFFDIPEERQSGDSGLDKDKIEEDSVSLPTRDWGRFVIGLWAGGALISLGGTLWQSWRTYRRWRVERLTTDRDLLELLEDVKALTGVTTPIGLIISEEVESPALLGWVRPRILLPRRAAGDLGRLRVILLHELAHVREGDILLGWLLLMVRSLHWFNPLAHLFLRQWARFREEAADERAIEWLCEESVEAAALSYGQTLLDLQRMAAPARSPLPGGAFALGEAFLKQRIIMIKNHPSRTPRAVLAFTFFSVLAFGSVIRPGDVHSEPLSNAEKAGESYPEAIKAMREWTGLIDAGKYAESWKQASAFFRKEVSSGQWTAALAQVRKPLGKLKSRTVASAMPTAVPSGEKTVVITCHSSFDGLPEAVERLTFSLEGDGQWRASGYFIRPK